MFPYQSKQSDTAISLGFDIAKSVKAGRAKEVEKMLEAGMDVNNQDGNNGQTALHWAMRFNKAKHTSILNKNNSNNDT